MEPKLLLPAGADGPAFMTFSNFDMFRRYNTPTNYALAAGLLGDAIAEKPGGGTDHSGSRPSAFRNPPDIAEMSGE